MGSNPIRATEGRHVNVDSYTQGGCQKTPQLLPSSQRIALKNQSRSSRRLRRRISQGQGIWNTVKANHHC